MRVLFTVIKTTDEKNYLGYEKIEVITIIYKHPFKGTLRHTYICYADGNLIEIDGEAFDTAVYINKVYKLDR